MAKHTPLSGVTGEYCVSFYFSFFGIVFVMRHRIIHLLNSSMLCYDDVLRLYLHTY